MTKKKWFLHSRLIFTNQITSTLLKNNPTYNTERALLQIHNTNYFHHFDAVMNLVQPKKRLEVFLCY